MSYLMQKPFYSISDGSRLTLRIIYTEGILKCIGVLKVSTSLLLTYLENSIFLNFSFGSAGFPCCAGCSGGDQGHSGCSARASHCSDFSWSTGSKGAWTSVVVARGLSRCSS